MLDRLAGRADDAHACGYEEAVLRGRGAALSPARAPNASTPPGCASLSGAKAALDAVGGATWGITSTLVHVPGPGEAYNQTEDEPYTLNPAVLHAVLDGVARAIEAVQSACA
jgi:hypothetical protein